MQKLLFLIFSFHCYLAVAQNLVPNPSFEDTVGCPTALGQLSKCQFWSNPLYPESPDYYNSCNGNSQCGVPGNRMGYELAHSGSAYAGIITSGKFANPTGNNLREYIQVKLLDTLETGARYFVNYYVSATDSSGYTSNDIGVYFSPVQVLDTCWPCKLNYTPQVENDSLNMLNSKDGWKEVSGTYLATGNELYMIIGNFKDSLTTTSTPTGWNQNPFTNVFSAYYIDDVSVIRIDSVVGIPQDEMELNFFVYPNPALKNVTVKSQMSKIQAVRIYNLLGLLVFEKNDIDNYLTELDISQLSSGIYFTYLETQNGMSASKLIIEK